MYELAEQLLSHLKAIWRYRWFAVALAWIIALFGWMVVYRMPDSYEASARVYVETQTVLRPLLAGLTAQPNVSQLAFMLSRTLISRPNMEKVIHMADIEIGLKTPEDRERLISRLTKELTIQSGGGENIYAIAYTDQNPQRAKQVVQSLLTIFMEGNLSDQRKDSEEARHFIDEQLKTYKERLDAAENALTEFRRRQMLMAGGRGDAYTRLVEAQAALSEATLELKVAEISRDAIKNNVTDEAEVPSLLGDNKSADVNAHPELDARIQALEQKIDGLRINYTEEHPDIVAIKSLIAQLKEQKKAESNLRSSSPSATQIQDPIRSQLNVSLTLAEANVVAVKARVAEFSKRYEELKATAMVVPQMDAENTQLTREYEVSKTNYATLLSRRETARISGEMETRTRGIDFRVIDPPRVSFVPKGPNRRLLNSVVLLIALGGGVAFAFLISQVRPTFTDERRLREVSGLPVLGTVIMAWTDAQTARRTRGFIALLISVASLLSAYAVIMAGFVLTASGL